MTAVRCGAPFAHQLEIYKAGGQPDLVFGKGIRACGIAVNWEGINIIANTIPPWNQTIQVLLAKQQDWPEQAVKIGALLRRVLGEVSKDPAAIKGLNSLIWPLSAQSVGLSRSLLPARRLSIRRYLCLVLLMPTQL